MRRAWPGPHAGSADEERRRKTREHQRGRQRAAAAAPAARSWPRWGEQTPRVECGHDLLFERGRRQIGGHL